MKMWFTVMGIAVIGWCSTGLYMVQGNERAVVCVFGRVQRDAVGNAELVKSGLRFTWPWPLSRVDRLKLNETRTLMIGLQNTPESSDVDAFLQPIAAGTQSQFLTGDKNIMNVQVTVQYRISEAQADRYLFQTVDGTQQLSACVESIAADLIARSGADFVHPLGLGVLRELLTQRAREAAEHLQLGLFVEDVSISSVSPPIRVKRDFLDVTNARADREKYVQSALAYAEQQRAAARAEANRIDNEARGYRRQVIERASGEEASFRELVTKLRQFGPPEAVEYQTARNLALQRRYIDTVESILTNVAGKVLLDSGKPVDITIFRDPRE